MHLHRGQVHQVQPTVPATVLTRADPGHEGGIDRKGDEVDTNVAGSRQSVAVIAKGDDRGRLNVWSQNVQLCEFSVLSSGSPACQTCQGFKKTLSRGVLLFETCCAQIH